MKRTLSSEDLWIILIALAVLFEQEKKKEEGITASGESMLLLVKTLYSLQRGLLEEGGLAVIEPIPLPLHLKTQISTGASRQQRPFPISSAQKRALDRVLALAGAGEEQDRAARHHHAEAATLLPPQEDVPITAGQLEQIRALCARLGEGEPEGMQQWSYKEAEDCITVLQMQIEDVLSTAEQARSAERGEGDDSPPPPSPEPLVTAQELARLKRAWMQAVGIQKATASTKQHWETFKENRCHRPIPDNALSKSHYATLQTAIDLLVSTGTTTQTSSANGHATRS